MDCCKRAWSDEGLTPKIVYQPKLDSNHHLVRFRKFIQIKYQINLGTYWELYEWSVEHYPEFWRCVWIYFNIIHSEPYVEVFDRKKGFHDMRWFRGAKLNYAENVFRFRDSHTALIVTDEYDNEETVSYLQMYDEVKTYAAALKAVGVKQGDKVICYMSNRKEAMLTFLATAYISAIFCGTLPFFDAKAVLNRFEQTNPKILFSVENFPLSGEIIDMLPNLKEIAQGLPALQKIIVVPSKKTSSPESIKEIPKCCLLSDFLALGDSSAQLKFEQVPFDHPLWLSYTSGTTGKPKGLVHSTGSFIVALRDFGIHQNCERSDVIFSASQVGWISWTMFTNALHLGLTLCMYEGNPYDKSPEHYWDMIDKFQISTIFIVTSTLERFKTKRFVPNSNHNLKNLRQIFGIGTTVNPEIFEFMSTSIKSGIFCGSVYGSSELFCICCGMNSNLPVYSGEHQCFALGTGAKCLNKKGEPIIGERGELVISTPMPSLPVRIENDKNKKIFTESYLSQHKGYWNQSDNCWINPETKGFIVFGRSDGVMHRKDIEFSNSEIYFALENYPDVNDIICVPFFTPEKNEKIVLFVKMATGVELNSNIDKEIRQIIEDELTKLHVPDIILQTPEMPYSVNGKRLEVLVKNIINKYPYNTEVLKNPSSLEFFQNAPDSFKFE